MPTYAAPTGTIDVATLATLDMYIQMEAPTFDRWRLRQLVGQLEERWRRSPWNASSGDPVLRAVALFRMTRGPCRSLDMTIRLIQAASPKVRGVLP